MKDLNFTINNTMMEVCSTSYLSVIQRPVPLTMVLNLTCSCNRSPLCLKPRAPFARLGVFAAGERQFCNFSFKNSLQKTFAGNCQQGKNSATNTRNDIAVEDGSVTDNEEFCTDDITVDEMLMDKDEDYEDVYGMEEEPEPQVGDGGGGGGVVLGGTAWGSKALAIAEEVLLPFKDDLEIFAFKVSSSGDVCVRLDKLSDKYGCPSMDDIATFSSTYLKRLDEAKQGGVVPKNLGLEVSSPGAERIVRIPEDLERFKHLPMYVRYMKKTTEAEPGSQEQDGIFQVDCIEMESGHCIWRLANVRLNRELLGKGRTLNRKQRDWRLRMPFTSLLFVRLYLEV